MSLFERTLEFSGFPFKRAEQDYLQIQSLDSEAFDYWQLCQRLRMVKHHLDHSPFYQDLIGSAQKDELVRRLSENPQAKAVLAKGINSGSSLEDFRPENTQSLKTLVDTIWSRLPVMTKSDLQRPLQERYARGFGPNNTHRHKTSGSSGHPFVFVKDRYCHAYSWAEIKHLYHKWGIELGNDREARFYGIPLSGWSKYKEQLKDVLGRRKRMVIFNLSDQQLEGMLRQFKRTSFGYLNGYTSSIVRLAQFLSERSLVLKNLCPTLKACITTSEMLFAEDQSLIEQALGVPVINEYGASELGVIALANAQGGLVVNQSSVYLELIDDQGQPVEHGRHGRVVLTALHNKAHALIRYDIGDSAQWAETPADGPPIISQLLGRTNDVAHLADGKVVPGLTFYYVTKAVIQDDSPVQEFVIEQHRLDHFVIQYVSRRELNPTEIQNIRKAMSDYVGVGLSVSLVRKDYLDRSKRGKLKQFVNLIGESSAFSE